MDAWKRVVRTLFALDLRSLALFRIGLGLLVAADALWRMPDLRMFYSDDGVAPRAAILAGFWSRPRLSIHLLSGATEFQALLLGVAVVVGVLLALGWRTRVMTVVAYFLVLSVQQRVTFINTGADAVLCICLLFACFLPTGRYFSLDARRHPERVPAPPADGGDDVVVLPATAGFVFQLVFIYAFNVVNKFGDTWFNGTAVLQALHIDQHTTPIGHLMRDHLAWLSPPLTWGTLVVEASAVLLLLPFLVGPVRSVVIVALWGLHVGLAVCMYLGLFSPACMVAWLAVIPSAAWRWRPLSAVQRGLQRLVVGTATGPGSPARVDGVVHGVAHRVVRVVAGVAVAVIVACQLWLNVARVTETSAPRPMNQLARTFGFDQVWKLFAVNPSRHDGWFVVGGHLQNGDVVDLRRGGGAISHRKPRYVAHLNKTARWRIFTMNASNEDQRALRKAWAAWLCRSWNETHDGDERLLKVDMTFMLETTKRDYSTPKARKQDLGRFPCR